MLVNQSKNKICQFCQFILWTDSANGNVLLFLQQFVLTPRTEEKYNKINQEFDQMMKKNLLHPVSILRHF